MQIREIRKKFGSSFFWCFVDGGGKADLCGEADFRGKADFGGKGGFRWKIDNKMEAGYNKNILDIFSYFVRLNDQIWDDRIDE
ncbi:hypothetical protein [Brotaphodocola sp.]|uniref:hypothetical protein n=1 Tax=Brotaphodocola sp. TaxID=3073577 RepID=UPI003D7DD1C7